MKRTIEITNKTSWRTADLRRFAILAAREVFDEGTYPRRVVTFRYHRRKGYRLIGAPVAVLPSDPEERARYEEKLKRIGERCHISGWAGAWSGGRASIGSNRSTITIASVAAPDKIDLLHTLVHEFGHNRGMRHAQMRGAARWTRTGNWRELFAYAMDLPLRRVEEKVKARPVGMALVEIKHARAVAAVKRWETKAKRAATGLKGARAKVRYYERRAAALRSGKEGTT